LNLNRTIKYPVVFIKQLGFFITSQLRAVICLILMVFFIQQSIAQKVVRKSVIDPKVSLISIDASSSFEIKMSTHTSNEMVVEAAIEGEYQDDLLLNVDSEGSTINVNTGFNPNFINPNDKLSAHKVISISLQIVLPENKNVVVFGNECNVSAEGKYELLKVTLDDGQCELTSVTEKAIINTQSGNITINSSKAKVTANTKFGSIKGDSFTEGDNQFIITTVTGNIALNRVE